MSANPEAVKSLDSQKMDPLFENAVVALASSSKCYPFPSNLISVSFRFHFSQLNSNSEADLLQALRQMGSSAVRV